MRKEKDSLGSLAIPDDRLYGVHTARALDNFGDMGERHDPLFVKAYLLVKKAAAMVNAELGYLEKEKAQAIIKGIDSMLTNDHFEDIVVSPLSGGAGTSLNMNVNEVVANKALELVGRPKGDYHTSIPLTM